MKKGVLIVEVTAATQNAQQTTALFSTALGWMALTLNENVIQGLTFGHPTARAARAAFSSGGAAHAHSRHLNLPSPGNTASGSPCIDRLAGWLIKRLQAYANGRRVDFDDIEIDARSLSDFGRRVAMECRKIPYGKTLTYGQLAAKAGNPGAARAVGNRMAANRIPIIVPCHRVLPSGRGLGGFSATGGVELKRRLLEMEARKGKRR